MTKSGLPSVSAQSRAASSGSIVSALRSRAASVAVVASSSRSSGTVVTALSWPKRVDESDEGMMLRDLLRADGTHDEDRCRRSGTDDEADHFDGLGVAPLQIVDDQQTRAVADDGPAHCIEQPMALSQVARPARCGWRGSLEELGEETSELGPPDRAQRVDVAPESIRSEEVDDRAPRQSARRLVRPSRSHHVSLGSNAPSQLQGEAGLPDPRFAGHQHEMGPPLPRRVPCLVELVQLEARGPRTALRRRVPASSPCSSSRLGVLARSCRYIAPMASPGSTARSRSSTSAYRW